MTRKKVKLAYIPNDSARKATFKKRKKGLMKKVSELSTLCGIEACAIIFSPYDAQPEIWPSPMGVQRVLSQFKKMPEMEQSKKMVNQDSFLRQRIAKANEQLKRQRKDNREKEITQVMFQGLTAGKVLQGLNMLDLNDLGWIVDQNLKEISKRIVMLSKGGGSSSSATTVQYSSSQEETTAPVSASQGEKCSGFEQMGMEAMQKQQWFVDLMNPQDNNMGGFGGEEVMFPFGDGGSTHSSLWSNPFYP
ncbi:agamous-like MADS-box protein AGL80 [Melia azedarach]|uniref:Agamous-like MADS-box protein AGL80 n=1 Tax=Melia azedarach TaxID=155640 RepID=A0ACC1YFB3_MELAZ|nr:agamous-like MADS-box protein AGL80 [Melia azedarach]